MPMKSVNSLDIGLESIDSLQSLGNRSSLSIVIKTWALYPTFSFL